MEEGEDRKSELTLLDTFLKCYSCECNGRWTCSIKKRYSLCKCLPYPYPGARAQSYFRIFPPNYKGEELSSRSSRSIYSSLCKVLYSVEIQQKKRKRASTNCLPNNL